jgi:hypothetical protein
MSISLDDVARMSPAQQESIRRQLAAQSRPLCPSTDTKPPEFELVPEPDIKVARRNRQIEFGEQCRFFGLINSRLDPVSGDPKPGWDGADMIYAVPNSNVAGPAVGSKLVQSGLRKGYPDINVDVARTVRGHIYHGLRIELKQPQGTPSDVEVHQREWHDKLRRQGYRVAVCFGWTEAWAVACDYLGWE